MTLPPQQCIKGFARPCRDKPDPSSIFTDLMFTCPFTSSPTTVSPKSNSVDISSPGSRRTAFPKVPIPQSAWSTDSEVFSDTDHRIGSPSLISSIFSRNPSCSGSGSGSGSGSSHIPITPVSSNKPILRRPDCTSASTSASEDNGIFDISRGLGISSKTRTSPPVVSLPQPTLSRKRSTLTFAVKCNVTSDSGHSPVSSFSRPHCRNYSKSPARHLPAWNDVDDEDDEDGDENDDEEDDEEEGRLHYDIDEESDSDEGYQEDEEGGFTDDEDLIGTFTGLPRLPWVVSAKWKQSQLSAASPSTSTSSSARRRQYPGYISQSEDGDIYHSQPRGRKISIISTKSDYCSRHVSPPPSRPSSPTRTTPSCPPAARSPSAIGLCRRRESKNAGSGCGGLGWKSDDNTNNDYFPLGEQRTRSNASSLAPPTSILRPHTDFANPTNTFCSKGPINTTISPKSNGMDIALEDSVKLSRRVSAPACSPIVIHREKGKEEMRGTMRESAKAGLEEFLRRGSHK